jgi:hypothetical protein
MRTGLRFFVYACAFVGAGWFGLWAYDFGWGGPFTVIVLAALAVAWLFIRLERG